MLFMIDLPELMPLKTALLRHGMIAMKTGYSVDAQFRAGSRAAQAPAPTSPHRSIVHFSGHHDQRLVRQAGLSLLKFVSFQVVLFQQIVKIRPVLTGKLGSLAYVAFRHGQHLNEIVPLEGIAGVFQRS